MIALAMLSGACGETAAHSAPAASGVPVFEIYQRGEQAFDRKQYGTNSGIPFIKIADRVEVTEILRENE